MNDPLVEVSAGSHQGKFKSARPDILNILPNLIEKALSVKFSEPTNAGDTARIFTLSDKKWASGQEPDGLIEPAKAFTQHLRELALLVCTEVGEQYDCKSAIEIARTNLSGAAREWLTNCRMREVFGDNKKNFDNGAARTAMGRRENLISNLDGMTARMVDGMSDALKEKRLAATSPCYNNF